MYKGTIVFCICKFLASDTFANCISFLGLIVAVITLIIGGSKVHEFLIDFNKKKRNAVYSYYSNLKIFINRLIRLTINDQNNALGHIYLLSPNEELRKKYINCKKLSVKLSVLSEKFLDYLSSASDQIPIATNEKEDKNWSNLIEQLSVFLCDFLLFDSGVYLPNLNTEESINKYCNNLYSISQDLLNLIEKSKQEFWNEISEKTS